MMSQIWSSEDYFISTYIVLMLFYTQMMKYLASLTIFNATLLMTW